METIWKKKKKIKFVIMRENFRLKCAVPLSNGSFDSERGGFDPKKGWSDPERDWRLVQ